MGNSGDVWRVCVYDGACLTQDGTCKCVQFVAGARVLDACDECAGCLVHFFFFCETRLFIYIYGRKARMCEFRGVLDSSGPVRKHANVGQGSVELGDGCRVSSRVVGNVDGCDEQVACADSGCLVRLESGCRPT